MCLSDDNYSLNEHFCSKNSNRIKVFGKGTISVKPDSAEVVVGVITENVELETAQQENAKITMQVINSLIEIGVLPKYIKTEGYTIRANYDYVNGKQIFRGYEVNNSLNINIANINSAGEIIDTAVSNGANTVSGINFIVSDEKKYYYEALSLAVADAQNKAAVIANKLRVNLNATPIQINEKSRENIAPLGAVTFKAASYTTPVEAGENQINSEIEAVFMYSEY